MKPQTTVSKEGKWIMLYPSLAVARLFLLLHLALVIIACLEIATVEDRHERWLVTTLSVINAPSGLLTEWLKEWGRHSDYFEIFVIGLAGSVQWFLIGWGLGKLSILALKKRINFPVSLGGGLFLFHALAVWIAYLIDKRESMNKAFYVGWSVAIAIIDWPVTNLMMELDIPYHPFNDVIFGGLQWFLIGMGLGWMGIKLTRGFLRNSTDKEVVNSIKTN